MANFEDCLNTIMEGAYGEDVTASIVEALNICYNGIGGVSDQIDGDFSLTEEQIETLRGLSDNPSSDYPGYPDVAFF